jgi:hypothetical protein
VSATAVITDIVTGVIAKLRGKPDALSASSVVDAVASKVTETVVAAIAVELQKAAAQLGVVLATWDVAEATQAVLTAFEARPGTSFGALPTEQVTEITDEDRAREKASMDALRDLPVATALPGPGEKG